MSHHIDTLPVTLPNGAAIRVEARVPAERDVSILDPEYVPVSVLRDAIGGLAELVDDAIQKVRPSKVTVEFSIELSYEAGKLTALLVNGSSKGILKLALEWSPGDGPAADAPS